jgi:hypothetical protein
MSRTSERQGATRVRKVAVVVVAVTIVAACGGGGGTDNAGLVQISTFIVSPGTVNCGGSLTVPLSEDASPDTVAVRAELVNTTASGVTLAAAGMSGFVIRSSPDSGDVGKMEINYPTIPYTPASVIARAKDGDVNVIMSMPATPLCNLKVPFFHGTQDIQITARLTTNSGLYTTAPTTLHVSWQNQ